jgi:hypothetical protein
MALDPRISLASLAPQVQMPNFVNTAMIAQQMQEQRQQQQLRMFQLSELLRQRQQEMDVDQYLGQMTGPQAAPGPATRSGVPPAIQGSYVQNPAQSPTRDYDLASPGTQAPPGTTYGMAPEAMQAPAVTPPAAARPSPEGLLAKGRPGREAYAAYTQGQMRQMEASQEQMKTSLMGMQYLNQRLSLPHDESSYQAVLADLTSKQPALADMLPKHYDPKVIAQIQAALQRGLAKGQQQRVGLEVHEMVNPQGKIVPGQLTTEGLQAAAVPEGYQYVPKTRQQNMPTVVQTVDALGRPIATAPKDITGAAQQRATGTEVGKEAGTRPERELQARNTLRRFDDKQAEAFAKVDKALNIINTANWPVTGKLGMIAEAFGYEPSMDLSSMLRTLRAQVGLDELVDLKARGGTLGTVSDAEGNRVASAIADLEKAQSKQSLIAALGTLKNVMQTTRTRLREAYDEQYTQRGGTTAPQGTQRQPTLEEVEAAIARRQGGRSAQ